MVTLTNSVCFLIFLRELLMFWPPRRSEVCRGFVRQGNFLAFWRLGQWHPIPIGSPSSTVANYRPIFITTILSNVFDRLVSVHLWRHMKRSGGLMVWVPVLYFCVFHTHQSEFKNGRRLGLCRLTSAQALTGSTVGEFSISSPLWVLENFCCLYWHRFYQIDRSTLWWTVVGVNCLALCQECRRAVFRARCCFSSTPRSIFPYWFSIIQ